MIPLKSDGGENPSEASVSAGYSTGFGTSGSTTFENSTSGGSYGNGGNVPGGSAARILCLPSLVHNTNGNSQFTITPKHMQGRITHRANRLWSHVDWVIPIVAFFLSAAGLVTMYSFSGESTLFGRQVTWLILGWCMFFLFSAIDVSFFRRTDVLVWMFLGITGILVALFVVGSDFHGAQSWLSLGSLTIQPADPAKLVLILLLAKYFSRRHIEIAHIRHILVSGFYAFVLFALVLFQPDFGSAMIIFFIWLGMVMVSGVSKKHLFALFALAAVAFAVLWQTGFDEYQKARIRTFIHPLADIRGTGWNAYQSTIAIGSGEIMGKGIGFGTQSRLQFLPEYETDFIFAAFSEEWGFGGAIMILLLFAILLWRILLVAFRAPTNFESLYAAGFAIFLASHMTIHIGMNMGLLPVTGLPLPFVSYGGSHIVTEFAGLGILMSMRRGSRAAHKEDMDRDIPGIVG